jgi:hypothetical protein
VPEHKTELTMSMVQSLLERLSTTTAAPNQVPLPQPKPNGNGGNGAHHHRRRSQFRDGARQAACRAFVGARFVLDYGVSIADASRCTGSNPGYVAALLQIIAAGDAAFLGAVLRGHVPVLLAGERAKKFNRLLKAYQEATPVTKAAFCKLVGQEKLFDELIAPATEAVTYETFLETPAEMNVEVLEAAE